MWGWRTKEGSLLLGRHLRLASTDGAPLVHPPAAARALDGLPPPRLIPAVARERRPPAPLLEAIAAVKAAARARFDEGVDIALRLGVDPRRGDQMVRGVAALPHGTGRALRVAVFATGADADAARAAGADVVGGDDLVERIVAGGGAGLDFDRAVATPEMMPRLGRAARLLGPRGLMPNPRLGTVTADVAGAVAALRAGRVEFRADRGAVVHAGVGRRSFADGALADNAAALAAAVLAARPKGVKGGGAGGYLLGATLSSTMGPGVPVALPSLLAAAQAARTRP